MAVTTQRFSCPACPRGLLLLAVGMEDHTVYTCDGEICGASLWVPTEHGHLMRRTERLRLARLKLAAKIRDLPGGDKLESSYDQDSRVVLEHAKRMLRQSQTLRQIADELLEKGRDLKNSVKPNQGGPRKARRARSS